MEETVLRASQGEFAIAILIAAVLSIVSFYYGFRFFRRVRIIEDIPTSTVRGAAQGFIELEGIAKMMEGEPIHAPLSGKPCVWFSYKVERKVRNHLDDRTHTHWQTIDQGVSDHLFHLQDRTGVCVIDPEEAEVIPTSSRIWSGSRDRPETWDGLAESSGFWASLFAGVGRYRYTEKLISTGDPLYAMGAFVTLGGDDGSYTVSAETRDLLAAWKRTPERILKHFDFNKDGEIDQAEWQIVRKQATRKVEQSRRERAHEAELHVMKKPTDQDHHYLLSVIPQSKLRLRYSLMSAGLLSMFILLIAGLSWALQIRSLF
ncbi:MAG: hypothetical protein DRQ61_09415 [Gammaproteobacteria bacterium]|nr:MAG: hypothetical protein DRQ61_09415 [Gammaproteobacteria bacterium]